MQPEDNKNPAAVLPNLHILSLFLILTLTFSAELVPRGLFVWLFCFVLFKTT